MFERSPLPAAAACLTALAVSLPPLFVPSLTCAPTLPAADQQQTPGRVFVGWCAPSLPLSPALRIAALGPPPTTPATDQHDTGASVYRLVRSAGGDAAAAKLRIHHSSVLFRCHPQWVCFYGAEQNDSGWWVPGGRAMCRGWLLTQPRRCMWWPEGSSCCCARSRLLWRRRCVLPGLGLRGRDRDAPLYFAASPRPAARPLLPPDTHPACLGRYEMRDVLAIESGWLTELAPHMYRLVPLNPQMRR